MGNTDEQESTPGNFWSWLRKHKRGSLHTELSDELAALVTAVQEHEKAGTLTVKITVSPTKEYNSVRITDEVKTVLPKADRGGSYMFSDADGGLHQHDPAQMSMDRDLRVVETSDGEPIVVATGTGEVIEV